MRRGISIGRAATSTVGAPGRRPKLIADSYLRRNRFQVLGICCIAGAKQRVRPEPTAQSAWIAADRRPIPVDGDARTGNFGDRGSVGVLPGRRCRQLRICRAINTFVLIGLDKDAAADQLNRHHRRDLDEVQSHETDCSTNIFRGSYREANQRCDAPSATICQQPQRKRIRS